MVLLVAFVSVGDTASAGVLPELSLRQSFDTCSEALDFCLDKDDFKNFNCDQEEKEGTPLCCREFRKLLGCLNESATVETCEPEDVVDDFYDENLDACEDFDECNLLAEDCVNDAKVRTACTGFPDEVAGNDDRTAECCGAYNNSIECILDATTEFQEGGCVPADFQKATSLDEIQIFCRDGLNDRCRKPIGDCVDMKLNETERECFQSPDFGEDKDCCEEWSIGETCTSNLTEEVRKVCTEADSNQWKEQFTKLQGEKCNMTEAPVASSSPAPTPAASGGSSAGRSAGIAIGVIAAIIVVGLVLFCLVRRRGRSVGPSGGVHPGGGGGYVPAEFDR